MKRLLIQFLRWFCKDDYLEEFEGDLLELYELDSIKSTKYANARLLWNVIRTFRIRNFKAIHIHGFSSVLWLSYLKVGWRNLKKDIYYTLFNIIGLAVGLTLFLTMILFVQFEYSFDRFHQKSDRVFQVIQEFENVDGLDPEIWTSLLLAEEAEQRIPEVESAVSVHAASDTWAEANSKRVFLDQGIVAGDEFFGLFDFPLLYGNTSTALKNARSIIIDKNLAMRLFGEQNVIGRTMHLERYGLFTVTAVMDQVPKHSFIQFDFIITQDYDEFFTHVHPQFPKIFQSWNGAVTATFLLLDNPANVEKVEASILSLLENHLEENERNPHRLYALKDLHFTLHGVDGSINSFIKGDTSKLYTLVAVSSLILLMALFNFINMLTARTYNRYKEVGIRKTMGAQKGSIFLQYVLEVAIQSTLAFVTAIALVQILLPFFSMILDIHLDIHFGLLLEAFPYILAMLLFVIIAGSVYPALILNRLHPARIFTLKIASKESHTIRYIMSFIHFSLVIGLGSFLYIIYEQNSFIQNRDLGITTEDLLVVEVNGAGVRNNFPVIKSQLLSHSSISGVTGMTRVMSGYRSPMGVHVTSPTKPNTPLGMRFYGMEADGMETLGLQLQSGNSFSGNSVVDSAHVLVNETAWNLLSRDVELGDDIEVVTENGLRTLTAKVIGVVRDFNYSTLHDPIGPLVIGYVNTSIENIDDIVIKLDRAKKMEALEWIEETHHAFDENGVITWKFLDDMIQDEYEAEATFQNILNGSSIMALLICIMGLVGSVSVILQAKIKEIGVKKVFGASYFQLLKDYSVRYVWVIALATAFITPITWYFTQTWLMQYAYRITLTLMPFFEVFLGVAFVILSTFILSSYHSFTRKLTESLSNE